MGDAWVQRDLRRRVDFIEEDLLFQVAAFTSDSPATALHCASQLIKYSCVYYCTVKITEKGTACLTKKVHLISSAFEHLPPTPPFFFFPLSLFEVLWSPALKDALGCFDSPSPCCSFAALVLNSAVISCSKRRSRMLSSTLLLLSWQPLMSLQYTLAWWVNRPLILWYFIEEEDYRHCLSSYQLSFLRLSLSPRVSVTGSLLKVSIADNGTECIL